MSSDQTECHSFRHFDGKRHSCHRQPASHRGDHHSDGGLVWSRHPHNRSIGFSDQRCDDCPDDSNPARPRVKKAK